ncbi:TPA: hypothetical protein NJ335_003883 [Vibrio parahaemolyticus]|nr:hypothetical protein [Vibrio parahaemolyticus]MBE3983865.1 hypothetical protein [Vibrio parahaemolyticus]HCG7194492.1 hypothetical protein [Vibrio parahaemolyticus]
MITSITDMDNFESEKKSKAENRRRINALLTAGGLHRELLFRLEDCTYEDIPCGSLACKLCNRDLRIAVVDSAVNCVLQSSSCDWSFLTVILYKKAFRHSHLFDFDIKATKKWFGRLLRDCGFRGPIWGMIEFDYHIYAEKWLPHYHVVLRRSQCNQRAYQRLMESRALKLSEEFLEGVRNQPLCNKLLKRADTVRVLSYTHKLYGKEYILNLNPESSRNKIERDLKGQLLADYLLFLDAHHYSELRFICGVTDKWAGLKTDYNHRRLYHDV